MQPQFNDEGTVPVGVPGVLVLLSLALAPATCTCFSRSTMMLLQSFSELLEAGEQSGALTRDVN
jgi:hypothetical protein